MMYQSTNHGSDVNILILCWFCVCYILKQLKDKKARSVHIYLHGFDVILIVKLHRRTRLGLVLLYTV